MTSSEMALEIEKNKKCYLQSLIDVLDFQESDDEYYDNVDINRGQEIGELIRTVCKEEVDLIGGTGYIHNVSVELARNNYFDLACDILMKGLSIKEYSRNCDLLADFLKYSTYSNVHAKTAAKCYNILLNIPMKRWGWRCFEFSIDYLFGCLDGELDTSEDEILKQCLLLAKKYLYQFKITGDADRAYHKLAEVYLKIGNKKKYIETLEDAVNNINQAPMCMLMMAEEYFSIGEYKKAEDHISQCIKMNIETSPNVEKGYPYIMRVVCRIRGIYEKLDNNNNAEYTFEKELDDIENDYTSAKNVLGERESRVRNAKQYIDNLKIYLNKDIDEEY